VGSANSIFMIATAVGFFYQKIIKMVKPNKLHFCFDMKRKGTCSSQTLKALPTSFFLVTTTAVAGKLVKIFPTL
jgi:hypothetical protein